jgi:hypothetical protein
MSVITISAGTFSPDISTTTVFCDTTKGQVNIILPNIQDSQLDRKEDYEFFVIDISDNASNNNIILTGLNSNGQQVNSKDKIILAQDGVVASLKPASYLNWVCNVSSLEAQQVVGLSNVGKTNIVSYDSPVSKLNFLRGSTSAVPYVAFDNKVYSGLSFHANVGSDYYVYQQMSRKKKGELDLGSTFILFKRVSENSVIPVDVLVVDDKDYDGRFDFINSTNNGFQELSAMGDKGSPQLVNVTIFTFTISNDKLKYAKTSSVVDLITLFNKYTTLNIQVSDNANFQTIEANFSADNNGNALVTGGKYSNYIYCQVQTGRNIGDRVFTSLETCDNIIGFNMLNVKEAVRVDMYSALIETGFKFNETEYVTPDKQADYLLSFSGQWTYTSEGIIFNFSDGYAVVKTLPTESNVLQGLTTIYCPQANRKVYQTIQDVGLNLQPIVSEGNLSNGAEFYRVSYTQNGIVILYPSESGTEFIQYNGFNYVGTVYNMKEGTATPFNTPLKGINRKSLSAIGFLNTNNGILYALRETGDNQEIYNKGTSDAVFIDSDANVTQISISANGLRYNSFTNNSAISTQNNGVSLKGLQILEDVFQNINNFNS